MGKNLHCECRSARADEFAIQLNSFSFCTISPSQTFSHRNYDAIVGAEMQSFSLASTFFPINFKSFLEMENDPLKTA